MNVKGMTDKGKYVKSCELEVVERNGRVNMYKNGGKRDITLLSLAALS